MPASSSIAADGSDAPDVSGESYDAIVENPFRSAAEAPLSTFSIDVDTASYSNMRRFLTNGQLPPRDAIRIEELVNYFDYDYPSPQDSTPFSVHTEIAPAPWRPEHALVHIGLQGRRVDLDNMPPRNLVFLLDVSGSMAAPNKLPLLLDALTLLVNQLGARDHVAIVVYAGASGVVLPPTPGDRKQDILAALRDLSAGGSTNGGEGIELAYQLAVKNFDRRAINRVILATDGDFNVGITDRGDLLQLIEKKRQTGVYLTVLGLGMGNLKDATMEQLADKGNGSYAYIDSIAEARKVLVDEAGSTLLTIAKDVKIQVAFDPAQVASYRLIGYENRLLRDSDFNNDARDAGEIGAGHTVTALYEVELTEELPRGQAAEAPMMTVRVRYKRPDSEQSQLVERTAAYQASALEDSSDAFRFAAAVAGFGMLLRGSEHKGSFTYPAVLALGKGALGSDQGGYRHQFLGLVETAWRLAEPESPRQASTSAAHAR